MLGPRVGWLRLVRCLQVCQALARLSANEDNKQVLTREGGVELLADVILSEEHSRKAITVKYCVEALWNLVGGWGFELDGLQH